MAFSKAQILTLAGTLCFDLDNSTTISTYFDDVVEEIGQSDKPFFLKGALTDIVSGTADYSFASDAIKIFHQFINDDEIFLSSIKELEAYSTDWATETGANVLASTQDLLNSEFKLYPIPNFTASDSSPAEPLGEDYQDDLVYSIYSDDRSSSIKDFFALILAILTLQKEFSYSAKHKDLEYAEACGEVAKILRTLIGN